MKRNTTLIPAMLVGVTAAMQKLKKVLKKTDLYSSYSKNCDKSVNKYWYDLSLGRDTD